jgi:hypothetical protein
MEKFNLWMIEFQAGYPNPLSDHLEEGDPSVRGVFVCNPNISDPLLLLEEKLAEQGMRLQKAEAHPTKLETPLDSSTDSARHLKERGYYLKLESSTPL